MREMGKTSRRPVFSPQLKHEASTLSSSELRSVVAQTDLDRMWQKDLKPMLVVRYPGSSGSQDVQQVSVQVKHPYKPTRNEKFIHACPLSLAH